MPWGLPDGAASSSVRFETYRRWMVVEIDPADVETMLWGPPGGQVEVAVRQNGEQQKYRLTRRALLGEH